MAKKTVFRRLSKWITLSPEYHDILEKDFDSFENLNTPSAKASIPPPPLKITKDEPKFEEKIVEAEVVAEPVQSLKDKIRQGNPATEEEPPSREPGQDDDEPSKAEYDERSIDGLKGKIRDKAAGYFATPLEFGIWLKETTTNKEKGFTGFSDLGACRSIAQARFIIGALERKMEGKK